jgi:hypothetical protein
MGKDKGKGIKDKTWEQPDRTKGKWERIRAKG